MDESKYRYFKHCQLLLENLRVILRDETMLDLTIVCSEGDMVRSSSSLLTAVSPVLREVLLNQNSEDEHYIMLPDVPASHVSCFLAKLLEWHAMPSKFDLHMMYSVLEALGSYHDVNVPSILDLDQARTNPAMDTDVTEVTYEVVTASQDVNKENLQVLDATVSRKKATQTVKTIYRCDKCMKQFGIKRDFLNHINAHLGIKPHTCQLCNKSFTQKSHLNTHMSIHSGAKRYICYKCGRAFNVSSNLKKHLAVHFRDQDEPEYQEDEMADLSPGEPSEVFMVKKGPIVTLATNESSQRQGESAPEEITEKLDVGQGEETENQSDAPDQNMSIKQKATENARALETEAGPQNLSLDRGFMQAGLLLSQEHESEVSDQNYIHIVPVMKPAIELDTGVQYKCDPGSAQRLDSQSGSSYRAQDLATAPYQAQPSEIRTGLRCNFCVKIFKQKSHLNHHVRVKHLKGQHLEKFSCKECDRKFTSTSSLKSHMMLHRNERPHECNHCGKRFVQTFHLKIHMSKHLGDKPYLCVVCGKSFAVKGRLNEHTKIHTGERKMFECTECPAKYFGFHDLQVHMRKHTGEFPYQCSHCSKQFRSHRNRDNHERTHTGERPYQCKGCRKGYGSCSSLHQHYTKSAECKAVAMQSHTGLYVKQEKHSVSEVMLEMAPHHTST